MSFILKVSYAKHLIIKGSHMIDKEKFSMYSIFNGLTNQELEAVLSCCEHVRFKTNEIIITESAVNSDLYILVEGRVSVELGIGFENTTDREQVVILRAGDIFGEIAFLESRRRSAHVIAMDDIETIKLDKIKLDNLFNKNNYIGFVIMKNIAITLSNRLIDTNFRWKNDFRNITSNFI